MTGVPRYDVLPALRRASPARGEKKTLLFCGSSTVSYDFDDLYPVLGCEWFLAECLEWYLNDLLDIVEKRKDLLVRIKPHYEEIEIYNRVLAARPASAGGKTPLPATQGPLAGSPSVITLVQVISISTPISSQVSISEAGTVISR